MKQRPPCDASSGTVPESVPADAGSADPVAAWAGLGAAARAVADAPLWRCSDEQLVALLRAQVGHLPRIDAARLALIRELDARGWAAAVGATSTQAWLAQALLVDPRTAAADGRAARALDPAGDREPEPGVPVMTGARRSDADPVLAATGRALTNGTISRPHADAVLASVRALPARPDGTTREDLIDDA